MSPFAGMTFTVFLAFAFLLDAGSLANKALFRKETGVYFQYNVIRSEHAANEFQCAALCSNHPSCGSVNYKTSGEESEKCELLLEGSQCKSRKRNQEYVYLQLVKPLCKTNSKSPTGLYSSISLKGKDEYVRRLTRWLNGTTNWKLCYRASQHGWSANVFHSVCDEKGPTVTIVRVGDYIFGGYADISWGGNGYRESSNCFLFSLDKNHAPFELGANHDRAIYSKPVLGPTFGGGFDLNIDLYRSDKSFSNLGHTYQLPPGYTKGSDAAKSMLAGSRIFIPTEVEVFYLDN